ncbi:hypothetical protein [Paludisphaera rhizosphaerae]|uniref:hypothetical protein n=1 Tax=Paludisphaera rhizosphaerae TaxID=2711216 RepID=UPI0013E9EB58|nr:hypothetical protein [Paludisphaera rhizosphaerae]
MTPAPRLARVLALLIPAAAMGCGGPTPCIVSGSILVDDQPAEGVYVVFHPAGKPASSPDVGSSRTVQDGSFKAIVEAPGESAVTVFWPRAKLQDGDLLEGPDLFGGKHRDPQNPVATLTVEEGDNALAPIKLTSPPHGKRSSVRR